MKPYFLVVYNRIRLMWQRLFHCHNFVFGSVELLGWNTRLSLEKESRVIFGEHLVRDGRLVIIAGQNARLTIGEQTYFNEGTMISCLEKISIGTGCRFGPNVKLFDNDHKFTAQNGVSQQHTSAPVIIGNHCWLGANVTILKGTQIGNNCVIGAGCVVKGFISEGSLVTQSRELEIRPIQDKERS